MKTIITIVGISIFNHLESADKSTLGQLENLGFDQWNEKTEAGYISELKTIVEKKLKRDDKISAEIQSILAIQREIKEDVTVELIATDTILSVLAAELIEEWFVNQNYKDIKVVFNSKLNIINGLQLTDYSRFISIGFRSLILKIKEYTSDWGYSGHLIFNLTGGYKAITSLLTTIAQVEGILCYYLFEEEPTKGEYKLIKIPRVPLEINTNLFVQYFDEFERISSNLEESSAYSSQFRTDAEDLLITENRLVYLNEYAQILWEKFLHTHFIYWTSAEIQAKIDGNNDLKRILKTKFHNPEQRAKHNKAEDSHKLVFKEPHNEHRIYYFEKNTMVYVYRIFSTGEHSKHEKFIQEVKLNETLKQIELNRAQRFILKIEAGKGISTLNS